jgi:hypothetical protein
LERGQAARRGGSSGPAGLKPSSGGSEWATKANASLGAFKATGKAVARAGGAE